MQLQPGDFYGPWQTDQLEATFYWVGNSSLPFYSYRRSDDEEGPRCAARNIVASTRLIVMRNRLEELFEHGLPESFRPSGEHAQIVKAQILGVLEARLGWFDEPCGLTGRQARQIAHLGIALLNRDAAHINSDTPVSFGPRARNEALYLISTVRLALSSVTFSAVQPIDARKLEAKWHHYRAVLRKHLAQSQR